MQRIRKHLSYANVMATLAVFIALGGGTTAVALSGQNTVQSDDLGPGAQVKAPDVADNAVNSQDVVNNSILGADLASSARPHGRAISSFCNPESTTFEDCGAVTINLARTSRVLIVASGMWYSVSGGATRGVCRIEVDEGPIGNSVFPGQLLSNSNNVHEQNLGTLTNVTAPLPPGNHAFGLACSQEEGNIDLDETYVSAVVLGSG